MEKENGEQMKKNISDIILSKEKIIIGVLIAFIIIGFALNFKLTNSVGNTVEETVIASEDREIISYITSDENKNQDEKVFENEYLKKLEEVKAKSKDVTIDKEIGKIYYFLGLNSYIHDNDDLTIKYYEKAINILEYWKNYTLLLNIYNNLMNIYYVRVDQVKSLEYANEIYSIFQREKIVGMSEKGQIALKLDVIAGIVTTTSNFKLKDVSERFYNELVTLSAENKDVQNNIHIYAKYQYNLDNGNYEEAKKYALEYIDTFKELPQEQKDGAHIYLLEALIYKKEFDNIDEIFNIVERGYKKVNNPLYNATLDKLRGYYYEGLGEYSKSIEFLDKAVEEFDKIDGIVYSIEITEKIISFKDKVDIDLNKYVDRAIAYSKEYNNSEKLGILTNSLVELSFKKGEEENNELKEQAKLSETINQLSKKINIIYILIILFLICITKMLKNEVINRKSKESELEHMVQTDYLTKAYSKQFIFGEIDRKIKEKVEFSLLLFDLDNFKKINDNYGHNFGDEVLINIVKKIKEVIGDNAIIGRFGGEEFIILINESVDNDKLTNEILSEVRKVKYSKDIKVTISGGLRTWKGETVQSIMHEADMLLYKAKKEGKDRILKE